jgi:hypothetical protein
MEPLQTRILSQVPRSIDVALSRLNTNIPTTAYAVCPACHYTVPPTAAAGNPRYPERCPNRPKPEAGPCDEPLLEESQGNLSCRPRKIFLYHHFADYLAGLLSRHEAIMDKSCDDCIESLQLTNPTFISSVFDAEFVKSFEGPVPGTLFIQRPGNEGRYLFALNVDFFNVEGSRTRGSSTSCGLISLACLNLPIEVRYKPENMYLNIIPGPEEPPLTSLNHYQRPLMDDMVDAWEKGIYISRTPAHPHGRNTRSAIALSVNDLPAARKAASLASHSSHFYCSRCKCHHLSTRGATDFDKWRVRNPAEMRRQAEAWRDASTSLEQTKLFQANGIRWSELWRLPYWDPTRQLVVDAMHCILEGLARYHSRDVLGLTSAAAAVKIHDPPAFLLEFHDPSPDAMSERDRQHVTQLHTLLTLPIMGDDVQGEIYRLSEKLHKKNATSLRFVVEDLGLAIDSQLNPIRKRDYVAALVEWVRTSFMTINPTLLNTPIEEENAFCLPCSTFANFQPYRPPTYQRCHQKCDHTIMVEVGSTQFWRCCRWHIES